MQVDEFVYIGKCLLKMENDGVNLSYLKAYRKVVNAMKSIVRKYLSRKAKIGYV